MRLIILLSLLAITACSMIYVSGDGNRIERKENTKLLDLTTAEEISWPDLENQK